MKKVLKTDEWTVPALDMLISDKDGAPKISSIPWNVKTSKENRRIYSNSELDFRYNTPFVIVAIQVKDIDNFHSGLVKLSGIHPVKYYKSMDGKYLEPISVTLEAENETELMRLKRELSDLYCERRNNLSTHEYDRLKKVYPVPSMVPEPEVNWKDVVAFQIQYLDEVKKRGKKAIHII